MARSPLYAEIKRRLRAEIDEGIFPEGARLTPEVELAKRFGVSRPTVRQAILELARDGVVARRRGHGTVVLPRRLGYPVGQLTSFSEEFAASGSVTDSVVRACDVVPADDELASRMGLPVGSLVFRLDRVRSVDHRRVVWQRSHIPYQRVPGIERVDFTDRSLYALLRERYRVTIPAADEVIRADSAGEEDATILEISAGDPVFRVERRGYDEAGALIELVDNVYRSDRYEIRLVLRR